MKIAVYTICKDELPNVEPWIKSCQEADYVVVADTGSTDGTINEFEDFEGVSVHRIGISPFRFDDAHNAALALVPSDADVCIPLHLDERLMHGWRDAIERKWIPGRVTKAFYNYQFSPGYMFWQNRIHARNGYRWLYPAHEGVYPYGIEEHSVMIPDLKIVQTQDTSKDRMSRDLELLSLGIKENPDSARMNYYWSRQLMYAGRYTEALHFAERYSSLPGTFDEERKQVAGCIAQCRGMLSPSGRTDTGATGSRSNPPPLYYGEPRKEQKQTPEMILPGVWKV